MLIHIINGIYAHRTDGYLTPKTRYDAPFAVEDAEAERLAALGVAEIVNPAGRAQAADTQSSEEYIDIPEENSPAQRQETASGEPVYSAGNTAKELTAFCTDYGIEIPARASKKQILSILDAFFHEEAPALSAAMPS